MTTAVGSSTTQLPILGGPVEVRLLDDTGHLLMEERPGAYAEHVAAFLTAP